MHREYVKEVDTGSSHVERAGLVAQHIAFVSRFTRLIDALLVFACLYLVVRISGESWGQNYLTVAVLTILLFELTSSFFDLYRSWRIIRFRYEIMHIALDWSLVCGATAFILYAFDVANNVGNDVVLIWFVTTPGLIVLGHYTIRLLERHSRAFGYDTRKVAFAGANDRTLGLINTFEGHQWMGMQVLGIFDDRVAADDRDLVVPVDDLAGNMADLVELARQGDIDTVFITLPMVAEKRIKQLIDSFSDTTASIYYCPSFFSFDLLNAHWDYISDQPVVSVLESPFKGHAAIVKRLEDIALTAVILTLVLVPGLFIAAAIALTSPGPVFFRQSRYGYNGKKFMMWKFRTMYAEASKEEYSQATRNDPRVTPIGAYLRKTSLDELPQLINVIRGEMSVVGPRPHPDIVNEDLRRQIHRYMIRYKIKPGITGLAQVSGFRGETVKLEMMEKRIAYDLQYMKDWTLWLDITILFRTLLVAIGDDVY